MDKMLDIVGASILWGFLLLIMIGVNARINSHSFDSLNTAITQMDGVELTRIIEFDFANIGDLVTGDIIIKADSNELQFYYDDQLDGTKDQLTYYIGSTSDLKESPNPYDKPVYRKLNSNIELIGSVSNIKFEYLDSLGQKINYTDLLNQTKRNNIKIIQIYLLHEGIYLNEGGYYPAVEWLRKINPKNL